MDIWTHPCPPRVTQVLQAIRRDKQRFGVIEVFYEVFYEAFHKAFHEAFYPLKASIQSLEQYYSNCRVYIRKAIKFIISHYFLDSLFS